MAPFFSEAVLTGVAVHRLAMSDDLEPFPSDPAEQWRQAGRNPLCEGQFVIFSHFSGRCQVLSVRDAVPRQSWPIHF